MDDDLDLKICRQICYKRTQVLSCSITIEDNTRRLPSVLGKLPWQFVGVNWLARLSRHVSWRRGTSGMWYRHVGSQFLFIQFNSNHVCSLATLRLIWSKRACCLVELFVAVSFLAVPVDIVTGRNPSLEHTCNASLRVGASLCSTWLDSPNETARCLRCQPADQTMFSLCNWLFFFLYSLVAIGKKCVVVVVVFWLILLHFKCFFISLCVNSLCFICFLFIYFELWSVRFVITRY